MPGEAVPLLGGQAGAVEGVFPGSHDVDSIHFDSFRAAPGGSRRERRAMVLRAAGPPPVEAEHGAGQVRRDGGAAGGRLELLLVDLQEAGRVSRQAGDLRAAQAGAVDGVLPSADDVDLVHGQVLLCRPALLEGSTGGAGLLLKQGALQRADRARRGRERAYDPEGSSLIGGSPGDVLDLPSGESSRCSRSSSRCWTTSSRCSSTSSHCWTTSSHCSCTSSRCWTTSNHCSCTSSRCWSLSSRCSGTGSRCWRHPRLWGETG